MNKILLLISLAFIACNNGPKMMTDDEALTFKVYWDARNGYLNQVGDLLNKKEYTLAGIVLQGFDRADSDLAVYCKSIGKNYYHDGVLFTKTPGTDMYFYMTIDGSSRIEHQEDTIRRLWNDSGLTIGQPVKVWQRSRRKQRRLK